MNHASTSTALCFVLATLAGGANAEAAPEMGCQARLYADSSSVGTASVTSLGDGSHYWRDDDALRVGYGTDAAAGVRALKANTSLQPASETHREGITARVERIGQGLSAAKPLVSGLVLDVRGSDVPGESKLLSLVLAAGGVMAFVARRRRTR